MNTHRNDIVAFAESLGLVCNYEFKGQGWSRIYLQLPRNNDLNLQFARLMFKDCQFQWVHWYMTHNGEILPLHYYMAAIELYVKTGVELDAVAFAELKSDAENAADYEREIKIEKRFALPYKKKRPPISPRNPLKHLKIMIDGFNVGNYNEMVSEVVDRPVKLQAFRDKLIDLFVDRLFAENCPQNV